MLRRLAWTLGWAGTVLTANAWAQFPTGPEFQVNTYTTGPQYSAVTASDAAGDFVVVWTSQSGDGSNAGIFARKYLASGVPLGTSEFQVNAYTTGAQKAPSVASAPTGDLVVVWESNGQDGNGYGVVGRRFDPAGNPGPEFQVNSYTTSNQYLPRVAMDAAGDFVVAWRSYGQDGSITGVFAQRFDAAGAAQGTEFRVNGYTTGFQDNVAVAMDAAGNFVVVWDGQDGDNRGVLGRRYDASGVPQGGEFVVNSYTTGGQVQPSVAMDEDGRFVVVWGSAGADGSNYGVFGQAYNASGVPQGPQFQVNVYTTGLQQLSTVAFAGDGFVVSWSSNLQDGDADGVFGRVFDAFGVPEGGEFAVNTYTTSLQRIPVFAPQPGGRFVVSWRSLGQDGDSYGVFARRFARDLIFKDGFESGDLSRWSSASTDGGDLAASPAASMRFTDVGLAGVVDDTASLFVEDDTPIDEDRYRARFYLDTNDFDPGETAGAHRTRVFIVFEEAPTRRLAAIVLRRTGGLYALEARARLDNDALADTGFFDIAAGAHVVEIDWKRSSGPDADDGSFELWIDGVSRSTLTGLDNSRSTVDFVRLGALSVKATANGTLFWDEFESRRINYIGN